MASRGHHRKRITKYVKPKLTLESTYIAAAGRWTRVSLPTRSRCRSFGVFVHRHAPVSGASSPARVRSTVSSRSIFARLARRSARPRIQTTMLPCQWFDCRRCSHRTVEYNLSRARHASAGEPDHASGRKPPAISVAARLGAHQSNRRLRLAQQHASGAG